MTRFLKAVEINKVNSDNEASEAENINHIDNDETENSKSKLLSQTRYNNIKTLNYTQILRVNTTPATSQNNTIQVKKMFILLNLKR